MDDKTKKIGVTVLIGLTCVAGVALLFLWMDLMLGVCSSDKLQEIASNGMLSLLTFYKSSSIALLVLISVTVFAVVLGFFSKNKALRSIILSVESVTIIICIVICALANRYCYSVTNPEEINPYTITSVTAIQGSLLQIIGALAILLTATSIWYISGFVKAPFAKQQPGRPLKNNEIPSANNQCTIPMGMPYAVNQPSVPNGGMPYIINQQSAPQWNGGIPYANNQPGDPQWNGGTPYIVNQPSAPQWNGGIPYANNQSGEPHWNGGTPYLVNQPSTPQWNGGIPYNQPSVPQWNGGMPYAVNQPSVPNGGMPYANNQPSTPQWNGGMPYIVNQPSTPPSSLKANQPKEPQPKTSLKPAQPKAPQLNEKEFLEKSQTSAPLIKEDKL